MGFADGAIVGIVVCPCQDLGAVLWYELSEGEGIEITIECVSAGVGVFLVGGADGVERAIEVVWAGAVEPGFERAVHDGYVIADVL